MKSVDQFEQASLYALLYPQSFQVVAHSFFDPSRSLLIPRDFFTLSKSMGVYPKKRSQGESLPVIPLWNRVAALHRSVGDKVRGLWHSQKAAQHRRTPSET